MRTKTQKQLIPIDESTRIMIDPRNYILQFRRKSKRLLTWRNIGFFPNLTSLCLEYLNSYPRRSENAINSIQELTDSIKSAEARICQIIIKK